MRPAAGVPVDVIEAEPLVGGQCRNTEHDGFRFDPDYHFFLYCLSNSSTNFMSGNISACNSISLPVVGCLKCNA